MVLDLRQRFRGMPILLDLEQDSVDARAACLCAGADDFWLSSIGPSDLLLRLRLHRTVQARLGQRPTLLELGDLSLDPATRQVRRAGRTDVSDLAVSVNALTPVSEPLCAVA